MRNAVFYTKIPMDIKTCYDAIKTYYKGAKNSDVNICIGKPPKSLYIWFPSTDLNDPIEAADMMEDIDKIPFEFPYFTHIDFHTMDTLQNVVKTIISLYPELIIWTDDDKFYTAEEFVNIQPT